MPGRTLPARELRSLTAATLLFSGQKTLADGAGSTTPVDTLGSVVDSDEITWTLAGGELSFADGGFFLVSLLGGFTSNGSGTVRRVHLQGVVGSTTTVRISAFVQSAFSSSSGTGLHASTTIPLEIAPGERLTVHGRQDSGGNLAVTVWLGFVRLPTSP